MVLLAKVLGPEGYGMLIGIAGIGTAAGSFVGLGFGMLLVREVSQDPHSFPRAWRRAWQTTAITACALVAMFPVVASCLAGSHAQIDLWSYVLIAVPELVAIPVMLLCSQAFQARNQMGWAAALLAAGPTGNIVAIAVARICEPQLDLDSYLPFHAAAALLAACSCLLLVHVRLTPDRHPFVLSKHNVREGLMFSALRGVDSAMNTLDKTLVLRLAGSEVAGAYGVAHRLVTILSIPLVSLAAAALPKLYSSANHDRITFRRLQRLMILATLGYGALAALLMFCATLLLPLVLGTAFDLSAVMSRALCATPLIYGLITLGGQILIAKNLPFKRITAHTLGILTMLAIGVWLLPRDSMQGPVVMMLAAYTVTASTVWFYVLRLR